MRGKKMDDDHQLMVRVREGDLDALGHLFESFHQRLYGFCRRLVGNPAAAEDVVQEVFCRVLKYRHTFRDEGDVTVWLYRLTRNACIDHLRKSSRTQALSLEPDEDGSGLPELRSDRPLPLDDLESAESLALLGQAMERLPIANRELLELARFQGLRYEQISNLLGCTVGAVKVRVHRAVKQLREVYLGLAEGVTP